jgi:hypothetical protein
VNGAAFVNDIATETRIVSIDCSECGVTYGLGAEFVKRHREDHRTFYCPNGHTQWWAPPKRTEADRLREQLEASRSLAKRERERRETAERSVIAYKGVVTRTKRRAAHGICPAPGCHRSFADVARHMAGQHPDFVAENGMPS